MNSRELATWKLTTEWPVAEASVEGNFHLHVDEAKYKNSYGNHRSIVKLEVIDEAHHEFDASGVLIGLDLVLTSAHNVLYRGGETFVSRVMSVKAYIGYHRSKSSKGIGVEKRFGKRVIVLQAWERSGFAWHNDMALIKLESDFLQVEPALYQAPPLVWSEVLGIGYPGENTTQGSGSCPLCEDAGCMYEVVGGARCEDDGLLECKLLAVSGNSGSPIFLKDEPRPRKNTLRTVIATCSGSKSKEGTIYAAPVDVPFIQATKYFLSQQHLPSNLHFIMHQQPDTQTWTIFQSTEI
ncbi:uncharacterized protein J4E84_003117 [Alternaria hordeiaustralica]|uniref:uncharacterized protein n=1 Tax=Alternaria hordeiaustralica TaxID=1187925 RepID=UPI0020C4D6F0|nr:uncharacterized protein J4E84_003117 [Alternaria hordeiaustralica]KAI4692149.1 hypothetical protein J4E84_003117 [Alternaria hordeiaustralica]